MGARFSDIYTERRSAYDIVLGERCSAYDKGDIVLGERCSAYDKGERYKEEERYEEERRSAYGGRSGYRSGYDRFLGELLSAYDKGDIVLGERCSAYDKGDIVLGERCSAYDKGERYKEEERYEEERCSAYGGRSGYRSGYDRFLGELLSAYLLQDPAFYTEPHTEGFGYVSSGKWWQYYDPSGAKMQKQRILKRTGLLKEELDWPGIRLIAGSLQKDGYITHDEFEQISDKSQPRRKAVDMLLKVVLGNLSTVSAFMRILNSESDFSYVAGRLNRTQLPAKELNIQPRKRCKRLNRHQKGSVSDSVKKIVSILRTATAKQKLRSYASKHLNLELKEAFMESFGIMFTFKIEDQLQKLKDPFPTGSAVTEE